MPMTTTKTSGFTVAGANRALPLVRSIVADLVAEFGRMKDAGRERRALEVETGTSGVANARIEELKTEASERSVRIDGYLKELADLGVDVKDLEKGYVEFPSERRGRPVLLCWQPGEAAVSNWHGPDETFSDRRPLPNGESASGTGAA